ncbi:hypothetical protein BSL82_03025 [Tardibacter chloracetimidivorans]|uniref:Secreted protein n=1 Tax=Tardibacter chloracetimidivorans TaxID=1921510 RepID=A0A1L3ZS09_9SPHN|nr:hypothetical protein [Tardibacter chloracetimidivorans]API58405.1 hypothetical protein BSL82_03025 [Tardibacter chloracetimidivorans]
MMKALMIAGLAIAALPAVAATPQAYEELDRTSSLACLRASGFRDAAYAPEPLRFSDRIGVDARLVTGTYAQSDMKGKQGMVLCLYDRKSKRAEVVDAAPWMSRKQVWPDDAPQKKR